MRWIDPIVQIMLAGLALVVVLLDTTPKRIWASLAIGALVVYLIAANFLFGS